MAIMHFCLGLAALILASMYCFYRRNARIGRRYRRMLKPEIDIEKLKNLIGKQGVCRSACRPQGCIEIGGEVFAARADGLIAAGTRIEVVSFTVRTASTCFAGPMLEVRPCENCGSTVQKALEHRNAFP